MSRQQQEHAFSKARQRKQLRERRFLILGIALLFLLGGATLWILNSQGIVRGSWSSALLIVFTVLGVVVGLFQWLFPITSPPPQQHADAAAALPTPHIIVQVPQAALPSPPQPAVREKAAYRGIVGIPPPTDPRSIQQRQQAVEEIYSRLIQPEVTAIALTGIAGAGKSTLAALTYQYAEKQRRPGRGPFPAESLWLGVDASVTMDDLAGNLFEALGQPLPDLGALSLQNQARALLGALNTAELPRLIVFDQFENLLDWQTGHALPDRPGVGEWIDAVNSQPCACRILLTTRFRPQGTREYPPTYLQEYPVRGLEVSEGMELLHKLGVKGDEEELRTAVARCSGHAFALTLLASLLHHRNLSLTTFLQDPTTYGELWTGNIARNLLDYIYQQQLDATQRQLLLAFAVFREPVPVAAVETILGGTAEVGAGQMHAALDALLAQHLLQATGEGHYQPHAIVVQYALGQFVERDEAANQAALRAAHAKAAAYYLKLASTASPAREKRRHISDVEPFIEAVWHLCQAQQWQEAYRLMERERLFRDLKDGGGYGVLLELYKLLLPPEKWQAERLQAAHIFNNLGVVYRALGQMKRAREYLERALGMYEQEGDRVEESWSLHHLGRVYADIGNKEQARLYYEQALQICEEEGDRRGEAAALNSLGRVYGALGQKEREQHAYERALQINREVGDRRGEGTTLNNLGRVLDDLGQPEQARTAFEQALGIFREMGNLKGEGWTLNNLGKTCSTLGQQEQARTYLEQALLLRREVDHRGEGRTLNNLGAVYAGLQQPERARASYGEALRINREMGDHEGEGKTLRNFGILALAEHRYEIALAALLLAQKTLDELQSPYRAGTQERIDDIRQVVGEEQFAALRARVEPQASQVVNRAVQE
jgi:tetratricopeptide (TPR) repeat protein